MKEIQIVVLDYSLGNVNFHFVNNIEEDELERYVYGTLGYKETATSWMVVNHINCNYERN